MRMAAHVLGSIWITDGNARPQCGQPSVSVCSAISVLSVLRAFRSEEALDAAEPVIGGREGLVRSAGVADLVGLEARTNSEGQHGQRAEGVHDPAEHEHPLLPDRRPSA